MGTGRDLETERDQVSIQYLAPRQRVVDRQELGADWQVTITSGHHSRVPVGLTGDAIGLDVDLDLAGPASCYAEYCLPLTFCGDQHVLLHNQM